MYQDHSHRHYSKRYSLSLMTCCSWKLCSRWRAQLRCRRGTASRTSFLEYPGWQTCWEMSKDINKNRNDAFFHCLSNVYCNEVTHLAIAFLQYTSVHVQMQILLGLDASLAMCGLGHMQTWVSTSTSIACGSQHLWCHHHKEMRNQSWRIKTKFT